MADTTYQRAVERWVRDAWLPRRFGISFEARSLRLRSGGLFEFDAVSVDGRIAANISTSSERTASGKHGVAKVQKIRADMLFLLLAECEQRLIVLTEHDMFDWWRREVGRGRVPHEIAFEHARLPSEMASTLHRARDAASRELRARQ
jgi:hypothetical protein